MAFIIALGGEHERKRDIEKNKPAVVETGRVYEEKLERTAPGKAGRKLAGAIAPHRVGT